MSVNVITMLHRDRQAGTKSVQAHFVMLIKQIIPELHAGKTGKADTSMKIVQNCLIVKAFELSVAASILVTNQ